MASTAIMRAVTLQAETQATTRPPVSDRATGAVTTRLRPPQWITPAQTVPAPRKAPARVQLHRRVERQIVRKLLHRMGRPRQDARHFSPRRMAERLIALVATTTAIFLLGTYLQELLWAALAVATVLGLGFTEAEA